MDGGWGNRRNGRVEPGVTCEAGRNVIAALALSEPVTGLVTAFGGAL